jgi:hypothetical protein
VYKNEKQDTGRKDKWPINAEGSDKYLLNPGLAFFQEYETSIADSALVSSGRKPFANDRIRLCFDEGILIPFGASNGRVELGPVHLTLC